MHVMMKVYLLVILRLVKPIIFNYNKQIKVIEESIHVMFDELNDCCASIYFFNEFELNKYIDDEDEGVEYKFAYQSTHRDES